MNLPGCSCGHLFVSGGPQSQFASLHGYHQHSTGHPESAPCHILNVMEPFLIIAEFIHIMSVQYYYYYNLNHCYNRMITNITFLIQMSKCSHS